MVSWKSLAECYFAFQSLHAIYQKPKCHSFKRAFQLQLIGGIFLPVVLVPVWVNNKLRFMVMPIYPLSMPLPPDIGPMRASCHLGLAG